MSTDVSDENERFIEQAIVEGRFGNRRELLDQAVRLLRKESEGNGASQQRVESDEEWIADLHKWAASHRNIDLHVDFSRQSIYAGRGL